MLNKGIVLVLFCNSTMWKKPTKKIMLQDQGLLLLTFVHQVLARMQSTQSIINGIVLPNIGQRN